MRILARRSYAIVLILDGMLRRTKMETDVGILQAHNPSDIQETAQSGDTPALVVIVALSQSGMSLWNSLLLAQLDRAHHAWKAVWNSKTIPLVDRCSACNGIFPDSEYDFVDNRDITRPDSQKYQGQFLRKESLSKLKLSRIKVN